MTDAFAEARLKRIHLRSWRRGMREMDLILGGWADKNLSALRPDVLDLYEALIAVDDHEIHAWVTGRSSAPDRFKELIRDISEQVLHPRGA